MAAKINAVQQALPPDAAPLRCAGEAHTVTLSTSCVSKLPIKNQHYYYYYETFHLFRASSNNLIASFFKASARCA